MDLESLYARLPLPAQSLLVNIAGWRIKRRRYARAGEPIFQEVAARGDMGDDALRALQAERLRRCLAAASASPFWQARFREHRVDVEGEDPFSELAKLPILDKAQVKANVDRIRSPSIPPQTTVIRHTSGTTGSGLVFPETRECEWETWATWWRYRSWHGLDRETWCGYFGGRSIVPGDQQHPPFWRVNHPGRQLMFSAYHLSPTTVEAYYGALKKDRIEWIHGYPSLISLLSRLLEDAGLSPVSWVRNVTLGAESVGTVQLARISGTFPQAQISQHYGQAEGAANISQCVDGSLHVDEDFAFVEFVEIPEGEGLYRIVGTNWSNRAFPLLRYDTGDIAVLEPGLSCPCGLPGRIVKDIDGRREDTVLLASGIRVGRLDHIFKDMVNVSEAQIRQLKAGAISILIVRGASFTERDEGRLRQEIAKRLGSDLRVGVEYVDRIERTRAGKVRFVVSEMGDDSSDWSH